MLVCRPSGSGWESDALEKFGPAAAAHCARVRAPAAFRSGLPRAKQTRMVRPPRVRHPTATPETTPTSLTVTIPAPPPTEPKPDSTFTDQLAFWNRLA